MTTQNSSSSQVARSDPPMLVRAVGEGGGLRTNTAFHAAVGFSDAELVDKPLLDWIVPADHLAVRALLERGTGRCHARHLTRSGESLPLDLRATDAEDGVMVLGRAAEACGAVQPSASREHCGDDGGSVADTLDTIARIVEAQNPAFKCSILLVEDGHFVRGAGPSLPDAYNAAIDGFAIGPMVGSCGTAIYWNVPVIVEDIQSDPLWTVFAELAAEAGVAACWSHPFTSVGGRVLGALALYSPTPRAPTDELLGCLQAAAGMTGLAVERGRAEEALRAKRRRELELEEQLRQAAKMEALGVLASGVAHDFNNVLATILANAELAQDVLPPDSEVGEMLQDIVGASRRAGEFCKQMLAYGGRGPVVKSRIEIGSLLPELDGLVRAAMSGKTSIEYSLHGEPIFVEGDENQLLQVVMNLVTNAAEAIGESEGQILVSSALVNRDTADLRRLDAQVDLPPGQYVQLTVSDTGAGIDAATQARIFDPFFTTKLKGRGLGLAAVKGIVSGHRGVIHLESQPGEGTTFTVLLPTICGVPCVEEATANPAQAGQRKRILLVDDEDGLRTILSRRLKHAGYDVVEAVDGMEAIDLFHEQPNDIECVLLDVSMPKRNGEEVFHALREVRPELAIVVMSGLAEQDVLDRIGRAQLSGILQKPITTVDLLAALEEATSRN